LLLFALYLEKGRSYEKQGLAIDAVRAYERAISLDPRSVTPHLALGKLYQALGQNKEAASQFRMVLKLNPTGVKGREARSRLAETE